MVGTRANPHQKLTKEQLHSRAKGNVRKHKLKKNASSSSPLSSSKTVAGRPLPSTPPVTPEINLTGRIPGKPITRRDVPTCLDFGKYRRILFPGSNFCSPCDWWEIELNHRSQNNKRSLTRSRRYLCQCNHSSFSFPAIAPVTPDLPPIQTKRPVPTKYKQHTTANLLQGTLEREEEQEFLFTSVEENPPSVLHEADDGKPAYADKQDTDAFLQFVGFHNVGTHIESPCATSNKPQSILAASNPEFNEDSMLCSSSSDVNESDCEEHKPDSPKQIDHSTLTLTPKSSNRSFLATENVRLTSALKIEKKRNASTNRKVSRLKQKLLVARKKDEQELFRLKTSAKAVARQVKLYLQQQSRRKDRKQSDVVANFFKSLLSNEDNTEGEFSKELMECVEDNLCSVARRSIKLRFLTKQACLRLMDIEGHKISLQVFDLLRRLETGGKRYSRDSCLPSGGDIQKAQAIVDAFAKTQVKMKHGHLVSDRREEFIEYDCEELLTLMVGAYSLSDIAKQRAVRINLSIDGAEISKKITHVTCGFKISDVAAKCPITKRPLFLSSESALMQSRNLCIPVKMVMKRETTDIYDEFRGVFNSFRAMSDLWNEAADGPRPPSRWIEQGNLPIKLALNMDLSATWKFFGMGGAAKNTDRPCHCCPVTSDFLVTPHSEPCHKWCRDLHSGRPGWKCYHHKFLSSEYLEESAADFAVLERTLGEVIVSGMSLDTTGDGDCTDRTRKNDPNRIRIDEDPRVPMANSRSDNKSIHFDIEHHSVSESEVLAYSDLIDDELERRNLPINGDSIVDRRVALRESLIKEYKYRQLYEFLCMGERMSEGTALFVVLDSVPCILHMENRIGLKFMDLILTYGLSMCKSGDLYGEQYPNSATKRIDLFISNVEKVINLEILGVPGRAAQWAVPVEGTTISEKHIGTICLDNNKTRRVVSQFNLLIDLCVPEAGGKREQWKDSILNNYVPAFEMLQRKADFTTEDICAFQTRIDLWFQSYVDLTGIAGSTNYVHLLGSGHISQYLQHWGSLYSHSQQGWEGMNALIKLFYFRRTQRGGNSRRGGLGTQSRIMAVGRWLLRRAMWTAGFTYEFMEQQVRGTAHQEAVVSVDDTSNFVCVSGNINDDENHYDTSDSEDSCSSAL